MDPVFIPVIIIAIILLLFAFAVILNHEIYQYMLKASPTLAALAKLNASFFPQLAGSRGQVYNIHIKAKSKAQFNTHTIEHACSLYLLGHYKAYKPICEQYKRDEATYRDYILIHQDHHLCHCTLVDCKERRPQMVFILSLQGGDLALTPSCLHRKTCRSNTKQQAKS